jgi:hypothetical protein
MRKATLAANMTPLLAAWKAGHMALVSAIAATAQRRAPSRLSHLKKKNHMSVHHYRGLYENIALPFSFL